MFFIEESSVWRALRRETQSHRESMRQGLLILSWLSRPFLGYICPSDSNYQGLISPTDS